MKVKDILKIKGEALFTAAPSALLREAVATMAEHDIGSLVIMEGGQYVGVLTFRELILAINANDGACGPTSIAAVVRKNAPHCEPEDDLSVMREVMIGSHARYLPVIHEGVLLGVLSFYDVARAIHEEQKFENKMLKSYINDWPEDADDAKSRLIEAPGTPKKEPA